MRFLKDRKKRLVIVKRVEAENILAKKLLVCRTHPNNFSHFSDDKALEERKLDTRKN